MDYLHFGEKRTVLCPGERFRGRFATDAAHGAPRSESPELPGGVAGLSVRAVTGHRPYEPSARDPLSRKRRPQGAPLVGSRFGSQLRAVSVYTESALVFVSDAFSAVNRIHFT